MAHEVPIVPHLEQALTLSAVMAHLKQAVAEITANNEGIPVLNEQDRRRIQGILDDIATAKEQGYEVAEFIVAQTSYEAAFRFPEPHLVQVIYTLTNYEYNIHGRVQYQHAYVIRRVVNNMRDTRGRQIYQDYYTKRYYIIDGAAGSPSHLGFRTFELPALSNEGTRQALETRQALIELLRQDLARLGAE